MRFIDIGANLTDDMYTGQYAAMGSMGYHHPSTAAAVTQPAVLPASQSLAIDAGQANAAVAGMMTQWNLVCKTFNTNNDWNYYNS